MPATNENAHSLSLAGTELSGDSQKLSDLAFVDGQRVHVHLRETARGGYVVLVCVCLILLKLPLLTFSSRERIIKFHWRYAIYRYISAIYGPIVCVMMRMQAMHLSFYNFGDVR